MQAVIERDRTETIRDMVSLAKPRITLMVLITTAGGLALAGGVDLRTALLTLLGTALVVSSANTLNCWMERDSDRLMTRTMNRPLPAGRMAASTALYFGLTLGAVSIPLLTLGVNRLTGLLAAIALVSYVGIYTPLKQKTPAALLVGSVPGALPPLIGWTAVTGRLEWAGLALFGVLFFWQLPHFIAIAVFRQEEYTRAGIKVLPAVRGLRVAKYHAIVHSVLLLLVTVSLVPLHVAGIPYLIVATLLGAWIIALSVRGFETGSTYKSARQLFFASLIYLPALFTALALDALV
ncbi:MAG: Heme synthase, protoheme farnesyltransferase [Myxococcaceae bacterium]|nr:Heme synthase, protoheme farnesyltransferase [Myxococcaceae bacterium]